MERTPLQRLATLALGGQDVIVWLRERRPVGASQPSFGQLARELRQRSHGGVDVTDQTLANWWAQADDDHAEAAS